MRTVFKKSAKRIPTENRYNSKKNLEKKNKKEFDKCKQNSKQYFKNFNQKSKELCSAKIK